MSAAIAAGLGTDPEWPRSEDTIQSDLNRLAAELTQTADRAATVSDNETRMREAAQVRFVGVLVKSSGMSREAGELWVTAASRMVIAHDRTDLDAVYAERVARRAL